MFNFLNGKKTHIVATLTLIMAWLPPLQEYLIAMGATKAVGLVGTAGAVLMYAMRWVTERTTVTEARAEFPLPDGG